MEHSKDEEHDVPGVTPRELFSLLGNETRVAILESMWELWSPESDPYNREALSFSDIRAAVDVRDSGNFNYHLSQLNDHFVRQTEEGYRLTNAGLHVIRAVLAGSLTDPVNVDALETGVPCSYCGTVTILRYDDDHLYLLCPNCPGHTTSDRWPDGILASFGFPPAGLQNREANEVLQAGLTWYDAKTAPMMEGVCPECAGEVDESVVVCPDHEPLEDGVCERCLMVRPIWLLYECRNCRYWRIFSLERFLYDRPPVVSFFFERGVDLVDRRRETASYVLESDADVTSDDPLTIRVRLPFEGDVLRLGLETTYDSTEPFGHYGGNPSVYRGASLSVTDYEVVSDR
ncbi:hypothetical protein [Haloferax sp. YSMS24]|uniref:DUF7351 domain-containing protein n=1 Tax=Haloferax sp. YSMS24 TaxID=3388425 RepID=UPI00398D1C1E